MRIFIWIAAFVVSGCVTLIFLNLLLPLLISLFGTRRFAEQEGLDVGTYVFYGGIVSASAFTSVEGKYGMWAPSVLFPLIALFITVYSAFWLWSRGIGHRGREFQLIDGGIVRTADRQVLAPMWIERASEYIQTDAFRGYSLYALTLHDASGCLARNGYVSAEECKQIFRDTLQAGAENDCRGLDLYFIWRETPLRWLQMEMSQSWAAVLCGTLSELSPEGRDWWRQWLLPHFPDEGQGVVGPEELSARLEELLLHYSDRIDPAQGSDVTSLIHRSAGPIEMMTSCCRDLAIKAVAPHGATVAYTMEDRLVVTIEPASIEDTPPEKVLLRPARASGSFSPQHLLRPAVDEDHDLRV